MAVPVYRLLTAAELASAIGLELARRIREDDAHEGLTPMPVLREARRRALAQSGARAHRAVCRLGMR